MPSRREEALDFLYGRINFERTSTIPYHSNHFKLDRMQRLLACLGNPQQRLKVVHLTGTKGKGSTAKMVAAVMQEAGYRVGLYTSPHLERLEERFVINDQPIDEATLVQLVMRLAPVVTECDAYSETLGERGVTFFELTTALAFLFFETQQVDLAVLEVGLGGRLDSTNVCQPLVCGITSISFDHTKQLGNTLAEIAREKAGIIKRGVPVVSGVTATEPAAVIREIAQQQEARLYERETDFEMDLAADEQTLTYREKSSPAFSIEHLKLAMLGRHQFENAATAICLIRRLQEQGWKIGEEALRRGLASAQLPARFQVFPANASRPTVVVDAAHNIASVDALLATLQRTFPHKPRVLIFGTSKDKDARGMMHALLPRFEHLILTQYVMNPRFTPVEELHAIVAESRQKSEHPTEIRCAPTPADAWKLSLGIQPQPAVIVIAGSFFLAAELLPLVAG